MHYSSCRSPIIFITHKFSENISVRKHADSRHRQTCKYLVDIVFVWSPSVFWRRVPYEYLLIFIHQRLLVTNTHLAQLLEFFPPMTTTTTITQPPLRSRFFSLAAHKVRKLKWIYPSLHCGMIRRPRPLTRTDGGGQKPRKTWTWAWIRICGRSGVSVSYRNSTHLSVQTNEYANTNSIAFAKTW